MKEITNIEAYPVLDEPPPIKSKRKRTLRKDLSNNEPREFRHIIRHDSLELLNEERQNIRQTEEDYQKNIINNIQQYFSGVDPSYNQAPLKLPRIGVTRSLTKDDISYPANFVHVAHVDYHQVSRQIEEMSDFPGRNSTASDFAFNPKENLCKDDISEPRDFRHLAHIGLEDNQVRIETEDKTIKLAIDKAGSSDSNSKPINKDSWKNLAEVIQSNRMKNKENEVENVQRRVLTKDDIGCPENFKHLAHVDLNSGFNIEEMVEKSCQKEIDNKDKEIQNFISDIIDDKTPSNLIPSALTSQASTSKVSTSQASTSQASTSHASTSQISTIPSSTPIVKPIPKPRRFKKTDIQNPQDFRHNAHVSYNKEKPIDANDVVLKNFFKKAGVTEEHLKDVETRDFIFDFIRQYSKFGDDKNNQKKPVPSSYTRLAENLQEEVERRSQEEYRELLLATFRRHAPI